MRRLKRTTEDAAIIAKQIGRIISWKVEPAMFDMMVYGTGYTIVDEAWMFAFLRCVSDYMEPRP